MRTARPWLSRTLTGIAAFGLALTLAACGGGITGRAAISGFSPGAVPRGETVTVTGRNLGETAGTLTIGGEVAIITSWSDTSIEAVVPPTAANAWQPVAVSTSKGSATASAGLFVGVEYTGDDAGLRAFLHSQP